MSESRSTPDPSPARRTVENQDPPLSATWLSPGVVLAAFADTAVAFDMLTETAQVLSPTAAWLCSAPGPEAGDELVDTIARESADPGIDAIAVVNDAVASLRDLGLLGRSEPYRPPPPPGPPGNPAGPGRHIGVTHAVGVHRVAFRSDDPGLVDLIDAALGDSIDEPATEFLDAADSGSGGVDLFAWDECTFPSRDAMLVQPPTVLNDHAARSHGVLVLHAGTVVTPSGSTIVLTGAADDGKSTLTAALIEAGCDYLGDESITLGRDLVPYGYPKPLTLDANSRAVLGLPSAPFPHIGPESIRSDVRRLNGTRAPVDMVIAVAYRPGQPLVAQQLDPAGALRELCSNVLNLARADGAGLAALCSLASNTPVWTLTHPGFEEAVPWILGAPA